MLTGGVGFIAVTIVKLGAALATSTGVITAIKFFNTFELKEKKKGGIRNVPSEIDNLHEKFRHRS